MSLATKPLYFVFNEKLYKQVDAVLMKSTLQSTLANLFLFMLRRTSYKIANQFFSFIMNCTVFMIYLFYLCKQNLGF